MKRRGTGDRDGRNTRQKEVDNPYLAHVQGGRRSRQVEDVSLGRRRRRDHVGLLFHGEEEEEERTPSTRPNSGAPEVDQFLASISSERSEEREDGQMVNENPQQQLPPPKNLDTPGMEWWDVLFLPKDLRAEAASWNPETAPYDQLNLANQKASGYIEHPVPLAPTKASMDSDEPFKLYQTKKELKRIRRLNRAKLNKEKQDKIALGLIPPPPPKLRISNLLRVLSTEHAADPSAIEKRVREEMDIRQRQHEARNAANKLTPEEKFAKIRRRVEKDAQSPVVHIAVFRVTNFEMMQEQLSKKRMVKMLLNAKKLLVNGRVIVVRAPTSIPTMIFVEGGPKSIRKFVRLMLKRIDWKAKTIMEAAVSRIRALEAGEDDSSSESDVDDDGSSSSSGSSIEEQVELDDVAAVKDAASSRVSQPRQGVSASCKLVWQGTSTRREYDGFRREVVDSALDARQFLQVKNLAYLWDYVVAADDKDDAAPSLPV